MADFDDQVERLIGKLVAAGVELTVEGEELVYNGPARAIDDETLSTLREHKQAIVARLCQNRRRGVVALGPTTHEQRRMAQRSYASRHPASCNVCLRIDLHGSFDPRRLDRALTAVVVRHEALRTRFAWYGDRLLQEVIAPPNHILEILAPEHLAGASDGQLDDWCVRRGAGPFTLGLEPLLRCWYAPLAPDQAILLVAFHHIACDGWSLEVLVKEVTILYSQKANAEPQLPPVVMSGCEFARWELEWLTSGRVQAELSFWTEELRGATLSPRLTRASGTGMPGGDAAYVIRRIHPDQASRMGELARITSTTEFVAYLAAYAMLLREEIDEPECAVLVAVANRTKPEHQGLVGLHNGAVPIRCSASDGSSLDLVARQMGDRVVRSLEHQSCPIAVLVECLKYEYDQDVRFPLGFAFYPHAGSSVDCRNVAVSMRDVPLGGTRADLSLLVTRTGESAEILLEYASDHLDGDAAAALADRYLEIIDSAANVLSTIPNHA